MHNRDTQLKRCEAVDQESVAELLFQNLKAESSTVRLVPGGSCDGLQAVLVRDDALDLTLS